jgi:hypothetical protein
MGFFGEDGSPEKCTGYGGLQARPAGASDESGKGRKQEWFRRLSLFKGLAIILFCTFLALVVLAVAFS